MTIARTVVVVVIVVACIEDLGWIEAVPERLAELSLLLLDVELSWHEVVDGWSGLWSDGETKGVVLCDLKEVHFAFEI